MDIDTYKKIDSLFLPVSLMRQTTRFLTIVVTMAFVSVSGITPFVHLLS